MLRLLLILALALPSWATVACSSGSWSGSTCTGGSHPLTYTITGASSLSLTDVQATLDDAHLGDTIALEANKPLTLTSTQVLKVRKFQSGSGYVTFTSTEASKLPTDGVRITPAYLPLTAIIQKDPTNISIWNCGNAVVTPWMFIHGGKKQLVEHFKIRGITFRVSPLADRTRPSEIVPTGGGCSTAYWSRTMRTSIAMIQTGKDMNSNKDNGSNGPSSYATGFSETSLRSATSVGDTVIPVDDASGFEVGMTLAILDTTNGADWIVVSAVDTTPGANTVTSSRAMAFAHSSGREVNQQITDPERDMVNDIVFQHNMMISDGILRTPYGAYMDGRNMTFRDSFFSGFRGTDPTDARALLGSNGTGPVHMYNNYIEASAENAMPGGTVPTGDWEIGRDGTSRVWYNYFPKIVELARQGQWGRVIGDVVTTGGPTGQYGVPRLVFRGRYVWPTGSTTTTAKTFVTLNSGVACDTEPTWGTPTLGDVITDCNGIQYLYIGTNAPTILTSFKNNFEIKAGSNFDIRYNAFDGYPNNSDWNVSQFAALNFKAQSQGCTGGTTSWPNCYAARITNLNVENNKVVTQMQGINLGQGVGQIAFDMSNIVFRNNFILQTESGLNTTANSAFNIGVPASTDHVTNMEISNNTVYAPFTLSSSTGFNINNATDTTGANFPGTNRVAGNIWPGWAYSYRSASGNDGGNTLKIYPCNGLNQTTCPSTSWDKNIINGGWNNPTNNFPTGTVINNCSGTSACTQPAAWDNATTANGSVTTFVNRNYDYYRLGLQGFRLSKGHTWKRGLAGKDVGVDPDQVPDIRNLTVTATDRMALFQWQITPVMEVDQTTGKSMPCVVEVWSGDYEPPPYSNASYAGELSDIGTYYRQDADDADRNIRRGLDRMMIVGHTVPLTANTLYGYRLQCAGDVKHGYFTTAATLSSTSTKTIRRVIKDAGTASMLVQYGTTYSHSTDTITGSTASANCTSGNICSVSLTLNKGSVYYIRWLEKSSTGGAGTTLLSGKVDTIAINQ